MNRYIKIEGMLGDILGDDLARSNWKVTLGLNMTTQVLDDDICITYFEVINEEIFTEKASDFSFITEMSDLQSIIDDIESKNYDFFIKSNEGLMTANMNFLLTKGELDFDEMSVLLTEQEELEYLFNKGCSGITKERKFKTQHLKE